MTTKELSDVGITRIVMPRTKDEGTTPEPKNEPRKIKLVCLDCGRETTVDATHFHGCPSIKRLVAFYNRCPACELKEGLVTINDQ
jgi:hypothetical protein